jgi:hypothetical protein
MTLVSHRHSFVFLKTWKTAGTTLERVLGPYCVPEGEAAPEGPTESRVSDAGVIGARGDDVGTDGWTAHMPANRVRDLLGSERWARYLKVTAIRNPYDKVVSGFHHDLARIQANKANPTQLSADEVLKVFPVWLRQSGVLRPDESVWVADRKPCFDVAIRYEHLADDLAALCGRLGLPAPAPEALPRAKGGHRDGMHPWERYYDRDRAAIVERAYPCTFQVFGYPRLFADAA